MTEVLLGPNAEAAARQRHSRGSGESASERDAFIRLRCITAGRRSSRNGRGAGRSFLVLRSAKQQQQLLRGNKDEE